MFSKTILQCRLEIVKCDDTDVKNADFVAFVNTISTNSFQKLD